MICLVQEQIKVTNETSEESESLRGNNRDALRIYD